MSDALYAWIGVRTVIGGGPGNQGAGGVPHLQSGSWHPPPHTLAAVPPHESTTHGVHLDAGAHLRARVAPGAP